MIEIKEEKAGGSGQGGHIVKLEQGVWIYTADPATAKADHISLTIEMEQKVRFPAQNDIKK